MELDETQRAAFAAEVPYYVREHEDGTATLYATADDAEVSTGDSVRAVLQAAIDDGTLAPKAAVIRSDGEPDGEWRWMDASAVEDEPLGVGPTAQRIGEQSLWEMAASLNAKRTPMPLNGGPTEEGLANSEPHGDAIYGEGDHPANGWVHVGVPVISAEPRTHLYLYGEMLEVTAKEFDRGRLAFGSVYFAYDDVDADDNFAVLGAQLISHALTNDPAVTTLTAGSSRARTKRGKRFYCRATWRNHMKMQKTAPVSATDPKIDALALRMKDTSLTVAERTTALNELMVAARGPITDAYNQAADALGISAEERATNPWAVEDAAWDFRAGMKAEARLQAAAPAPDTTETDGDAERSAARMDLNDEEPTAMQSAMDVMRELFGKPDATDDEVAAEMVARKEELGSGLVADDEVDEGGEVTSEDETDEEEMTSEREDEEEEESETRSAKRSSMSPTERKLAARVAKFETRDWLDGQLAARQLTITDEVRAEYLEVATTKRGKALVKALLNQQNQPPTGNPLDGAWRERGDDTPTAEPEHFTAAVDQCMADATRQLEQAEEALAKEQSRPVRGIPRHHARKVAQTLAAQRYPKLMPGAAE